MKCPCILIVVYNLHLMHTNAILLLRQPTDLTRELSFVTFYYACARLILFGPGILLNVPKMRVRLLIYLKSINNPLCLPLCSLAPSLFRRIVIAIASLRLLRCAHAAVELIIDYKYTKFWIIIIYCLNPAVESSSQASTHEIIYIYKYNSMHREKRNIFPS